MFLVYCSLKAVIIGDLIDSIRYNPLELETVFGIINQEFVLFHSKYNVDFKIFRGDSFQGIIIDFLLILTIGSKLSTINKVGNLKGNPTLKSFQLLFFIV